MTQTALRLRDQLASLSDKDRAALAEFLLNSLPAGSDRDEVALDTELARREPDIRNGGVDGIPAEKVFTKLRKKYP